MKVLIVEDELHTARLLQEIIEQDNDFEVVEKLESVVETVQYLSQYQKDIDLLFFDIQLADGESFEIFKHVDVFIPVVFCTAYEEYPMQAIKNNGIDYVLKPFKEDEIHEALQKYKNLIHNLQAKNDLTIHFQDEKVKKYQQNFLTQFREKSILIDIKTVALFCVEFDNVNLYTLEGKKYPLFKTLEYIESVSNPKQFFRVNRQMLLNRSAIKSFEPYSNRKVALKLCIDFSYEIVVSRLKVSKFKKWLEK